MSNRRIATVSLALAVCAFLAIGLALLATGMGTEPARPSARDGEPREIHLIARDMAFYLEGGSTPNPTLSLEAAERVSITLHNRDPGMRHDLAAAQLGAVTPVLEWGSAASLELTAPEQPGTYEYICSLHPVLMRGRIDVR